MDKHSAYQEGFRSRMAGKAPGDNPHAAGTSQWREWHVGWDDQDEHLRERDRALNSIGLRLAAPTTPTQETET